MKTRSALAIAAACVFPFAVAATAPTVLSQISPGLWEFSGPRGAPLRRLCIGEPEMMAQVEHRGARCTRTIISNDARSALVDYSCRSGDFGHSRITVVTPRSMRVETQGISAGAPFAYVVQARRVGDC